MFSYNTYFKHINKNIIKNFHQFVLYLVKPKSSIALLNVWRISPQNIIINELCTILLESLEDGSPK